MRTLLVLIFMFLASLSAYAKDPCLGHGQWPSVVSKDEDAAVQIWYLSRQDGKKTSHVYIWYVYHADRQEGACVRLDGGGYSPNIYEFLKSGDEYLYAHARNFIEIRALTQGLLKYADPLGD